MKSIETANAGKSPLDIAGNYSILQGALQSSNPVSPFESPKSYANALIALSPKES